MSHDKTTPKIGTILKTEEQRDAIHIAVAPVICGDDYMYAGQWIGLKHNSSEIVVSREPSYGFTPIGIVDPFLSRDVTIKRGDRFYMFLIPQTITSLRHEWAHPAFGSQPSSKRGDEMFAVTERKEVVEAENWLHDFADKWHFNYEEMISGAQEDNGYVTARGRDLHSASELGEGDERMFWNCIEKVTGKKFDTQHKENFGWSCSC